MRTSETLRTEQLDQLRTMLEQQRDFRLEQLRALRRPHARGRLGSGHREISVVLTVGARNALEEVLAALRRMDEGSYGRCTECDGRIGVERLEILPQSALCMRCQRGAPR